MVTKILQIILALFIGMGGIIKMIKPNFQVEHWNLYQYPMWFMTVIGIFEIAASIALIFGLWNYNLAIFSSLIIIVLMIGAIYTHIFRVQQPLTMTIPSTVCLIAAIIIIIRYY